MEKEKRNDTLFEFLRYAVVGGISALVDMAVNYVILFFVLASTKENTLHVAVAVALGFAAGLAVNYILSNIFVFRRAEQREKGRTWRAFLIYVTVGLIGFGLTELFTLLGTRLIGEGKVWYLILTCVVKGIVLIWNYVGRKIFVYRGQ